MAQRTYLCYSLLLCLTSTIVTTCFRSSSENEIKEKLNYQSLQQSERSQNGKLFKYKNRNADEYVTLVYGNYRRKIRKPKSYYPAFLDPDITVLSTDTPLIFTKLYPTIGNGYLATVAQSETIYRSDLFNGYNITSHRARIPSTCSLQLTSCSEDIKSQRYSLDMGRAMYIEEYSGEYFHIEIKMYAHRVAKGIIVTELTVNTTTQLNLKLHVSSGRPSDDLQIIKNETINGTISYHAQTKQTEYGSPPNDVYVIASKVPEEISFEPYTSTSYLFLTAISNDEGATKDYLYEAYVAFMEGTLETSHVNAWEEEWRRGRIDFSGNKELSRVTYATLYYIMSSILPPDPDILVKPWPFIGLSPGDLAHGTISQDYMGHVFWDQETWMYPPIQMLHSDLGKIIINSRIRTLDAAKQNAAQRGYKGARYPWESAYTGLEVCPAEKFGRLEQHITGDVAFAVNQYFMMTNDVDFIKNGRGGELIDEIAKYWESRVVYNEEKKLYEIPGVMPPDEYHSPVNNSAYTNSIVKLTLLMTKNTLPLININTSRYEEIGNNMYIPFNETGKWHPEYDNYKEGVIVKQADVVLLGFPLMMNLTTEVRKNDLLIYEKVTPGGPAMTWGMFSIGWLELGEMDKANELFERQLHNVNKPFNVWSEVPLGLGALNFITGMGGYLQSLIFGYGGFRIRPERLDFNGNLPPNVTCFNVTGVDYLQGSVDFSFWNEGMSIMQTRAAITGLMVVLNSTGEQTPLIVGKSFTFKRQKASIYTVKHI